MKDLNKSFNQWRKRNPKKWELVQMTWYFNNKARILAGWSKPENGKPDLYDKWRMRND